MPTLTFFGLSTSSLYDLDALSSKEPYKDYLISGISNHATANEIVRAWAMASPTSKLRRLWTAPRASGKAEYSNTYFDNTPISKQAILANYVRREYRPSNRLPVTWPGVQINNLDIDSIAKTISFDFTFTTGIAGQGHVDLDFNDPYIRYIKAPDIAARMLPTELRTYKIPWNTPIVIRQQEASTYIETKDYIQQFESITKIKTKPLHDAVLDQLDAGVTIETAWMMPVLELNSLKDDRLLTAAGMAFLRIMEEFSSNAIFVDNYPVTGHGLTDDQIYDLDFRRKYKLGGVTNLDTTTAGTQSEYGWQLSFNSIGAREVPAGTATGFKVVSDPITFTVPGTALYSDISDEYNPGKIKKYVNSYIELTFKWNDKTIRLWAKDYVFRFIYRDPGDTQYSIYDTQTGTGDIGYYVPFPVEVAQSLNVYDRDIAVYSSWHMIMYATQKVKVKWYQTKQFSNLVKIAAIASLIVTLGQDAPLVAAVTAATGVTGAAAVAIALSITIIAGYAVGELARVLVAKFGDIGYVLAVLLAIAADSFLGTGSLEGVLTADIATAATALFKTFNLYTQIETQEVLEAMEEFEEKYEERIELIKEAKDKMPDINEYLSTSRWRNLVSNQDFDTSAEEFLHKTTSIFSLFDIDSAMIQSWYDFNLTLKV